MKRLFAILLCASMIACAAPTRISGDETPVFVPDGRAPASFAETELIVDEAVSAAETRSYYKNSEQIAVTDKDGAPLALDALAAAGSKLVCGSQSVTVRVRGDVNTDGKLNVRDVVNMMKSIVAEEANSVSDVNADGVLNARDVVSLMRKLVGCDEPFGEESVYAKSGASDATVYFDTLMHRVGQSDTTVYGDQIGLIRMAKNEIEDASMFVVSGKDRDEVTLEVGELKNDAGDVLDLTVLEGFAWSQTIFKRLVVRNVQAADNQVTDYFTEALPKLVGSFRLGANESKHFVLQVATEADAAPGYYSCDVVVRAADGAEIKRSVLRVLVWDFALDEESACDTAFGFSWSSVYGKEKKGDWDYINTSEFWNGERHEIIDEWMEFLMDNRISPYQLPYDILEDRADKYMDDVRVSSFCTLGGGQYQGVPNKSAAEVKAIYDKLRTKDEWLEKAYVYLVDEPCTPGGIQLSKGVYDFMAAAVPEKDFHIVVPLAMNELFTTDASNAEHTSVLTDTVEYTTWYSDILCPQSYAFTPYYSNEQRREAMKAGIELYPPGTNVNSWTSNRGYELFGNKEFQQRYDEYGEDGQKLWWYICISPMMPHPNYFKYYQGAAQRVTLWQQYMFHSNGLLYWATQEGWNGTNQKRNASSSGDGQLLYWGGIWGQTGPVSSIRLEYIRDGIEDFQYMKQLERAGVARDDVISGYVNRVTTEILRYSEDPADIEAARVDLGFALESAMD